MKKFLIICACMVVLYMGGTYIYYNTDFPWSADSGQAVKVSAKSQGKDIYVKQDGKWKKINICGMNLGNGIPGHFATDFAIGYDTYMEWFAMMQDMNVNVLRIYTIQDDVFYQAFYDYNKGRKNPLYLIHGIWMDDYSQRSHLDAFSPEVHDVFISDCKKVVDIVHGHRKIKFNSNYGSGNYKWDISPYVIGYLLGVEWEPDLVIYTDDKRDEVTSYSGDYFATTKEASPFECFLAEVGDRMMNYEVKKYSQQRLLAFSNWPETDPLDHQLWAEARTNNFVKVDVEHILLKDTVKSGTFASYHVYPYYPPFINNEKQFQVNGSKASYRTYLEALNKHHQDKPVVIAEFGLPTARGIAQEDESRGLDQGHLSEEEQGKGLRTLFQDIMKSGCAGGMIFSWQDEWFKRTWNTWPATDSTRTPFWSDVQTNEQMFGMITFDPGATKSICYVDGDLSEWKGVTPITKTKDMSLSMMYDERNLYLRIHKENLNLEKDTIYVPLDITPKSGAFTDETNHLTYTRPVDFVAVIQGKGNSRVLVQDYYHTAKALYGQYIEKTDPYLNPPEADSGKFVPILLYLRHDIKISDQEFLEPRLFETGKLTYGNGNPEAKDFNSLADYCVNGNDIELRLPWGLLNFSDPSAMKIHDDYYKCYGVENLQIDHLQAALYVKENQAITSAEFKPLELEGWGETPSWHQRIKKSYYMMQDVFARYSGKGD